MPLAKVDVPDDAPPPVANGPRPWWIQTKSFATVVPEAWLARSATTRSVTDSVETIPWCGYSKSVPADVESNHRCVVVRAVRAE